MLPKFLAPEVLPYASVEIVPARSSARVLPFPTSEELARSIQIESLTITPDVLPSHYVARAVILDLEPHQMVAAIIATEAAIRKTHRFAHRSGWRAASDGLTIFFHQWTPNRSAR